MEYSGTFQNGSFSLSRIMRGFFSWYSLWGTGRSPEGKTRKSLGTPQWLDPLEFLTLRLVYPGPWQFICYSSGFPTPGLVPLEVPAQCFCFIKFSVSACLSLQLWGQWCALWPHICNGSEKHGWFFSSPFYFLLGWSGLLSSLHARPETRSQTLLSIDKCISNFIYLAGYFSGDLH